MIVKRIEVHFEEEDVVKALLKECHLDAAERDQVLIRLDDVDASNDYVEPIMKKGLTLLINPSKETNDNG